MRVLSAAVGLVALVVVTLGWLESPDRLTSAEAATVAVHAYDVAGVDGAKVAPKPKAGVYVTVGGDARIPVWKTVATVDGGTIQLWLSRVDGESVFLDDRSADGTVQLLTDKQFSRLADHYENPTVDRQIHRNLLLTLAAGLIVLMAVRLSVTPIPVDARRLLGLDGSRARPRLPGADPRVDRSPVAAEDEWDLLAADEPEPDALEDDDEEAEDEEELDLAPDPVADGADEWEPMWEDNTPEEPGTTPEAEWEPMWDDDPGGTASVDPDDAGDAADDDPGGDHRSRLRASHRRQLRAPEDS